MSIVVKHISSEYDDKIRRKVRRFSVEGKEIIGETDHLSLNPLRFLEDALIKKGTKIRKIIEGNDPWNIEELKIESEEYDEIVRLLNEIMEYRCHATNDFKWDNIIRQLPFNVCMKTSDAIMNYGKDESDVEHDKFVSNMRWREIAREVRDEWGPSYAREYESGNPGNIVDSLTIPKDEPQKRIHLIYKSSRGGYNIKTQGYEDSSLTHYCWKDSRTWD